MSAKGLATWAPSWLRQGKWSQLALTPSLCRPRAGSPSLWAQTLPFPLARPHPHPRSASGSGTSETEWGCHHSVVRETEAPTEGG